MNLAEVYRVTGKSELASAQAVARLDAALGAMPVGYGTFVTTLGWGHLDDLIAVYPPERILEGLAAFRESWRTQQLWNEDVLPRARLIECIPVAETQFQDTVVFHPSEPDTCFVLPVRYQVIYRASNAGFLDTLHWILESGVTIERDPSWIEYLPGDKHRVVDFHFFESPVDRRHAEAYSNEPGSYDTLARICIDTFAGLDTARIFFLDHLGSDLGFRVFERQSGLFVHVQTVSERKAEAFIRFDTDADPSLATALVQQLGDLGFSVRIRPAVNRS